MATLTIRNLDEEVKRALRRRAAERGVSMEQEARDCLRRQTLGDKPLSADTAPEKPRWRLKASKEEILALGRRMPDDGFDLKKLTDEMWDEGLK